MGMQKYINLIWCHTDTMIDNVNMDIFVCPVQININRPAILTFWFDSVENGVFYNGLQKKLQDRGLGDGWISNVIVDF